MASIINAATSGGLVTTADTSGILQLQTAGTTAVTVDAAGGVKTLNTISVGNATPSTSGAGITFPATASASTSANTLDDYEEGTFTPTITAASGSNGGGTFDGSYIKVGRYVFATMRLQSVSKGTLSGQIAVGGLPFSVDVSNSTGTCRWDLGGGSPPAGATILCPQSNGSTTMEIQIFGGSGYLANLLASNLGTTFNFYNITYSYITA